MAPTPDLDPSGVPPPPSEPPPPTKSARLSYEPVVVIAIMILGGVILLIGSAIFGFDKGHVLMGMARVEFARGLITYLFAIVTIGTAVLLVVATLTGPADEHNEKRLQRGKEILALLLGVFGTIVGFYFGSEVGGASAEGLMVAPLRITRTGTPPNIVIGLATYVNGGKEPYQYALTMGGGAPGKFEPVPEGGWIVREVKASDLPGDSGQISIEVRDSQNHTVRQSAHIFGQ